MWQSLVALMDPIPSPPPRACGLSAPTMYSRSTDWTSPKGTAVPLHVLLVEDEDQDDRRAETYLSRGNDITVTRHASLGATGSTSRHYEFHVALLRLPCRYVLDVQTLESFMSTFGDLPVVVVTDCEDDPRALLAMQAGAKEHLGLDDITPRALMRTLRHVVAYHQLEREACFHEQRNLALHERGNEGKLILDATGAILYANAVAAEMLGRSIQQVRGKSVFEVVDPGNVPARRALLERVLRDPATEHTEIVNARKRDGTSRDVELRISNQLAAPNVEAILVTITDITQRLRERRAATESEARYRQLFDNSLDGMLITAPDGRIFDANPAFLNMLGYTREEAKERRLHRDDVLDESDPRLPAILEERRRTGRFHGELNFKHKNRTIVPTEMTTNVYVDAEGNERTSMIVRDISKRQRMERALQNHQMHLARAEKASLVMATHLDLDGRWTKVPPGLCDLLGYTEQELLALTFQDVTHPDDLAEDLRRTQEVLAGSSTSFEMEKRYLRKDGSDVWVHISVSLTTDTAGEPLHFLVYLRDTTAEKAANEQVLRHYALLLKQVTNLAEQAGLAEDHAGIYRALLALARTTTPADSLLVSHLDTESGLRRCVFAAEFVNGSYAEADVSQLPPMPINDSPQGQAVKERKAIVTEDLFYGNLPVVDIGRDDDDQPARSSIAMPLIVLGEVVGVFELQSTTRAAFQDEHVAQLQVAASLAAIATKNVDLLARERSARRRVEADTERLEAVLEQAPTLTASVEGPEHVYASANEKYYRFFGGRDLIGRRVVEVVPEVEEQGIITILDRVRATGESFIDHELPIDLDRCGTGKPERHYFDLVYQPLRDEHGVISGILAQAVDITGQVEARLRAEELHAELQAAYDSTIEGWARALDLKDEETAGHSQRVTNLTIDLSRRMGMSEEDLVHVRRGALLHDIGKMGVPDRILLKPGKLDPEEWEIMKRHTQNGMDFLHPIEHLRPAMDIPYCHHEKWDGSGYPRGLRGQQIPLAARIFAVVDVYGALTSDRPYRSAWSEEQALDHIRKGAGTHFDPAVANVFLSLLESAPIT